MSNSAKDVFDKVSFIKDDVPWHAGMTTAVIFAPDNPFAEKNRVPALRSHR